MSRIRSSPVGRVYAVGLASVIVALPLLAGCVADRSTTASVTASPRPTCAAATSPAPASDDPQTVVSAGIDRTYYLWLPPNRTAGNPAPLVLDLHATGSPALAYERDYSSMADVGPGRGYIVVAPQGSAIGVPIPHWAVPGLGTEPDDVQFLEDVVDDVARRFCVDRDRVYATGASAGAAMTGVLACSSDLVAAVAPVAGVNLARPCPGARPLPVIAFHGRNDQVAPYEGVPGAADAAPTEFFLGDVDAVMSGWAQRNRCSAVGTSAVAADVDVQTWTGCAAGATTQLYVTEAGHTNPGGKPWPAYVQDIIGTKEDAGGQTDSIVAVDLILDFFDAHRRPTG